MWHIDHCNSFLMASQILESSRSLQWPNTSPSTWLHKIKQASSITKLIPTGTYSKNSNLNREKLKHQACYVTVNATKWCSIPITLVLFLNRKSNFSLQAYQVVVGMSHTAQETAPILMLYEHPLWLQTWRCECGQQFTCKQASREQPVTFFSQHHCPSLWSL